MLGLVGEKRREAVYLRLGRGRGEDATRVRLLVTLVGQTCKETGMGNLQGDGDGKLARRRAWENWTFPEVLMDPQCTDGNERNFAYTNCKFCIKSFAMH